MLYKILEKHLGKEAALKLFPEYSTIPDKMSTQEQVSLARRVMDRMDKSLDFETIVKIRHGNTCNLPKEQRREMTELMSKCKDIHDFLIAYGYTKQEDGTYLSNFKQEKCYCGLFNKINKYEPISITWCECCNGHHEKILEKFVDNP